MKIATEIVKCFEFWEEDISRKDKWRGDVVVRENKDEIININVISKGSDQFYGLKQFEDYVNSLNEVLHELKGDCFE